MALILLRDQPGVDVLEYRFEERNWSPELLEEATHDLAEALFGISEYDIDDDWDDETYFPVLRYMRDESDAYWAKHGWDVTNGEGKQLQVMEYLARPMVCLVEGLHPDAKFKLSTDAWAARLEAEAKNYRPKR